MNNQINADTNTILRNQDVADTIPDANVCSGCGKHCSLKNPSCGKGAALARERGITVSGGETGFSGRPSQSVHSDRTGHPGQSRHFDSSGRTGHPGHFSHLDRSGHFDHEGADGRDGHKNYHRHSRHENYDFENCEDLDLLFRSCAHMLHHKERRSGSREQILTYLMENGSAFQKDIQEELRVQPGSVSELLSKLEKNDLIVRKKSRLDKRAVIISLTQKGAAETKVRLQKEENSPFDVLTDEEQETLRTILRKLLSSEG